MASPIISEVIGSGGAATWVAEVKLKGSPQQANMGALMVLMDGKPYRFGMFEISPGHQLMVIHSMICRITNCNCKSMLFGLFKSAKVDIDILSFTALNGYHLELFGIKPVPTATEPDPESPPDDELGPEEEEEVIELTSKANSMKELDQLVNEYLSNRDQLALALKSESASYKDEQPTKKLRWITGAPHELEIVANRSLREWQKLEWVLFRDQAMYGGDASLRTSPDIKHWDAFYHIYNDISTVDEPRKRMQQAFKTFAGHVLAVTGKVITQADLPKKVLGDKHIRDGQCYQCDKPIPSIEDMDGQIYTNLGMVVVRGLYDDKVVKDASRFGIFCSRRCSMGRCLGCAGDLAGGKCPNSWCGHDQKQNIRLAVPVGHGIKDYNEYIGEMDADDVKKGLPLRWPMCDAKKKCMYHGCERVCDRECGHHCNTYSSNCRRYHKRRRVSEQLSIGHPLCSCHPDWVHCNLR